MSGLVTQGRELQPKKPLQIDGRAMVGALCALRALSFDAAAAER